jgi:hypothetical protein
VGGKMEWWEGAECRSGFVVMATSQAAAL